MNPESVKYIELKLLGNLNPLHHLSPEKRHRYCLNPSPFSDFLGKPSEI